MGAGLLARRDSITGLQTDLLSSMDALYNLDRAKCQRPYEAGEVMPSAVEPSRCYHENWWKQMDTKGGKFCRRNYFIAGFFRSHCNSLYCIEMAKCCSVKRSIWKDCDWVALNAWTTAQNGFAISMQQVVSKTNSLLASSVILYTLSRASSH